MTPKLQKLSDGLKPLGLSPTERLGELTVEVKASEYKAICIRLRDDPALRFEQLIDLCGVDYAAYADKPRDGAPRFAAVLHLLSLHNNWRLRVRSFCPDDEFPVVSSMTEVWPAAGWFERLRPSKLDSRVQRALRVAARHRLGEREIDDANSILAGVHHEP